MQPTSKAAQNLAHMGLVDLAAVGASVGYHRKHVCAEEPFNMQGDHLSVAYYIVLDNEEPGFDTFVNGKYLAHEDGLDALCKQLHVKTFEDFLAMSGDDISAMLGEDTDLPEGERERWFSPEEGLAWVATLSAHIKANPASVKEPQGCLEDLAEYAEVLEKAKGIGASWHLNLDF